MKSINEGVYDPNILKAIFLAGGPGSGKSYAASKVFGVADIMKSTSATGLKQVNSDPAFEMFLKKSGVDPKNLSKMTDKVFKYYTDNPNAARQKARRMKAKLQAMYEDGKLGLVLDGTGANYSKIAKRKKRLEAQGYDCSMVFVNTSLKVAQERNLKRDRVLPADLLEKSWMDVQNNMGKFQSLFGSSFVIIDNTEVGNFNKMHADKIKGVSRLVSKPLKNPIGKKWIQDQLKLKSLGESKITIPNEPLTLGEEIAFTTILETISQEELDRFIIESNSTNLTGADVDDGPTGWYNSLAHFKDASTKMADRLGMKVVDYIMNDGDFQSFQDPYSSTSPSFFPAGLPGEGTPSNPKDYKSSQAYALWKKHIQQIASKLGIKFLSFKDEIPSKSPDGEKIEEPLTEGINDKYIFKAIFLAGGPGSGKSTVINKLFNDPSSKQIKSLTSTGLKVVNLDQALEYLKKKHKIPADSDAMTDAERSLDGKLMGKSVKIAKKQLENYLDGKLGIIIDGTGASSNALFGKKKSIEALGYDTYMVYVNTTLETALQRNANRPERKLLDKVVERVWQKVHDNFNTFKSGFGSNFVKVEADGNMIEKLPPGTKSAVMSFLNKPVKNKEALKWIKKSKKL